MARTSGSAVLGLIGAFLVLGATAVAADAPASVAEPAKPVPKTVYLYGAADLDHLRETDFNHYQRAQSILAAANKLCQPGPATVQYTQFDAQDVHCQSMLLMTSNPPKKQLEFRLDDVRYIALVTITDDQPSLMKAFEVGALSGSAPGPSSK
jgi:hypothetical protein